MARIALVTGGNRGLGLATARRLGVHGATVIVGARAAARGAHAVRALREAGIDAEGVALDVTDLASVRAAADEVRRRHRRLDVLVNNAGVLPEATAGAADAPIDVDLLRRTFETNVFGAAAVAQAFLPLLRRSEAGRIVNVSSTMGSLADQLDPASPFYGLIVPGYQASKAALNALTVSLSKALADTNVKVNSVCPGWVATDMGGAGGRPVGDGAAGIVWAATLPPDGPTGGFFRDGQAIPW
jgi:NAD(P)-dependent dehydrogenase (short-subunit alcohol dehydrogenase family)